MVYWFIVTKLSKTDIFQYMIILLAAYTTLQQLHKKDIEMARTIHKTKIKSYIGYIALKITFA